VAVLPRRSHERLNLEFGQVFTGAKLTVLRSLRHHCSFLGGWHDQLEMRITHENSLIASRHCSENSHLPNSRGADC
jgi:hypothetical protein